MLEQLLSEIAHHALPEQRGEHRLAIRAAEGEHERARVEERRAHRHRAIARGQRDVDHPLREEWTDQLQQPLGHQQHERAGHQALIWAHIHHEPSSQATIVALRDGVFV